MAANHTFDDVAYFQYKEEVLDSQGFFVNSNYGHYIPVGVVRIGEENSDVFKQAEEVSHFALVEENANLEVMKIVYLTKELTADTVYNITFEAKNLKNNEVNLYRTRVWKTINTGFRVKLFRQTQTTSSY